MKHTDDLQSELMSTTDISRFLRENEANFHSLDFTRQLQELFTQKAISKASLAKRAGMSEAYLYQVFSGARNPSRNRVLCLCFGLSVTLEEAQELLKCSGCSTLYIKHRRDAIIIHGLLNSLSLDQVNDKLYSEGETTLY